MNELEPKVNAETGIFGKKEEKKIVKDIEKSKLEIKMLKTMKMAEISMEELNEMDTRFKGKHIYIKTKNLKLLFYI